MNVTLTPGPRSGTVRIPASKSQAHRLLLCAALGTGETTLLCDGISADIEATARCLRTLGAEIEQPRAGVLRIRPLRGGEEGLCVLPCGESGSTLRFLLPVVGALGAKAVFHMECTILLVFGTRPEAIKMCPLVLYGQALYLVHLP